MSNDSLKRVAKGSGIILAGTLIGHLLYFICVTIIIGSISRSEYGLLSLSLALVNIVVNVSCLGLPQGVARYVSYFRGKGDAGGIWGSIKASLQVAISLSLLFSFVTLFSAGFLSRILHSSELAPVVRTLTFCVPFSVFTNVLLSVFRGFGRVEVKVAFQDLLGNLLRLSLLGVFFILGLSFSGVVHSFSIAPIVVAITLGGYALRKIPAFVPEAKSSPMRKELLCFSLPLLGIEVFNLLRNQADTLMLGYFKTPDLVGLYNGAVPLTRFGPIILSSVAFIYLPEISLLYSKGRFEEMRSLYSSVTKWVFLAVLPPLLVLLLAPKFALRLLFGQRYVGASGALRILALGLLIRTFLGPNGMTLMALGRTKPMMLSALIGAIINVILNLILIPRLGMEGAAVASATSIVTVGILVSFQVYRLSGIHPFISHQFPWGKSNWQRFGSLPGCLRRGKWAGMVEERVPSRPLQQQAASAIGMTTKGAPKVSFLMPAHNEEGIIERALDALERLKCPEVEVLVGLDGCTDGTREIVQRYDFVRFVELKERCGKPAVLRRLMDMAEGDIIVVHDADWRFVCDGERMKMLIEQFDDPQLGGVVLPPHDIPFPEMREGIGSNCFAGSGLGVLLLWEYLLRTQTKRVDDKMYVDKSKIAYPFTVDVFRRGIIPHVTTAADDFERFLFLARTDYSILILNDRNSPYFEITDRRLSFRGHFRQRVKGHIARAQIEEKLGFKPGLDFYLPFSLYCLKNIKRLGVKDFALVLAWALTILLAFFWAKIILRRGVPDAKKAWRYRVR